jgi:hypothetical protein
MSETPALSAEDKPAAKGSFGRGLVVALPLSLVAWLVFFWLA